MGIKWARRGVKAITGYRWTPRNLIKTLVMFGIGFGRKKFFSTFSGKNLTPLMDKNPNPTLWNFFCRKSSKKNLSKMGNQVVKVFRID